MGLFENGIGDIWWRIHVVKFKKLFQHAKCLFPTKEKTLHDDSVLVNLPVPHLIFKSSGI